MRHILPILLVSLSLAAYAQRSVAQLVQPKQPTEHPKVNSDLPVENVIVTAPKVRSEELLHNFVISHTAPTPLLGKIVRWKRGICPVTIGLPDKYGTFITQRIIKVAMMAGAPLDSREPCDPNLAVLATDEPQKFLDLVRAKHPVLLGFHYPSQAVSLATMQRPIQAWYSTEMEDYWGLVRSIVPDIVMAPVGAQGIPGGVYASGSRAFGDGLKAEIQFVMVVVDKRKLAGHEIGAVADYIAMLGLSQGQSYDFCQPVPTISNLLAANCVPEMKSNGLTDIDLSYLRGLYKMDAGRSFDGERASIAYEMSKELGGN